jgi:hypothetical protein
MQNITVADRYRLCLPPQLALAGIQVTKDALHNYGPPARCFRNSLYRRRRLQIEDGRAAIQALPSAEVPEALWPAPGLN